MLKKIIIGILAVAAVAAAALLVIGLLNPSVTSETNVEINKPREVVWNYFSDPNKLGEWLEGFQKIETISGNPNEIGSKYRLTFAEQGREIVVVETVTDYRVNEHFAFQLQHEIFKSEVEVTVAESNGKTILVQRETVTGSNIFMRILFALTKSSSEQRSLKNLEKLKANIERL